MKRSSVYRALLAVLVAAGAPFAAAATLIVPVSQTRTVSASAQTSGGVLSSSSFSASDFGSFDQSAGAQSYHPVYTTAFVSSGVRQISTIQDARLTSEVRASKSFYSFGSFIVGGALGQDSVYDVTFDLLEPARYSLLNGIFREPFENPVHTVKLLDANGQVIAQPAAATVPTPGSFPIGIPPTTGVLPAGRYRLIADWDWDFFFGDPVELRGYLDLSFTPIPEPGSALLLALGLGALAAGRARSES